MKAVEVREPVKGYGHLRAVKGISFEVMVCRRFSGRSAVLESEAV
jgi:hypothetical protein